MTDGEPGPRLVVAVVPDLMDRSRLRAPGVEVVTVSVAALHGELVSRGSEVALVVADLSRPGVLDAITGLEVPVAGFAPHVDDEMLGRARTAGVDAVPRSVFFRRWPDQLAPEPPT